MRTIAIFLIFMFAASPALAHKVIVFAYMEGNELVAEGSFPGGNPCMECGITLEDTGTGKTLLESQTDKKGICRMTLPPEAANASSGLLVVINGGEGHRGEWKLAPDEYMQHVEGAAQAAPATVAQNEPEAASPAVTPPATAQSTLPALNEKKLEAMISRSVAATVSRELAPLKREILEDKGTDLRDVLGGIGYIIGLAGIFAWARSRRT